MALRIIFSLALTIIFQGIVNLLFGLQYIAGMRLRETGSSVLTLQAAILKIVRVLSKRIPRRNIVRERNERGFHLFLQNLKGVVSVYASDEVFWTEDLIEETTQRLQDSYTTLTLTEHDMSSQMNDPLPEHVSFEEQCAISSKTFRVL